MSAEPASHPACHRCGHAYEAHAFPGRACSEAACGCPRHRFPPTPARPALGRCHRCNAAFTWRRRRGWRTLDEVRCPFCGRGLAPTSRQFAGAWWSLEPEPLPVDARRLAPPLPRRGRRR